MRDSESVLDADFSLCSPCRQHRLHAGAGGADVRIPRLELKARLRALSSSTPPLKAAS